MKIIYPVLAMACFPAVPSFAVALPANVQETKAQATESLTDRTHELQQIRLQVAKLEREVIQSLKDRRNAQSRIGKLKQLLFLEGKEKALSLQRLTKLEQFLKELERRKVFLKDKISEEQRQLRSSLADLDRSAAAPPNRKFPVPERERIEAPRRWVLSRLSEHYVHDIEALQVDLSDAEELESTIQREKHQLAYLLEELQERENLIRFHKQMQVEILHEKLKERAAQLESYRRLKETESAVEQLLSQFNTRVEFEKLAETERKVTRAMYEGDFLKARGRLSLPVSGKIVSNFGNFIDPALKLSVFKKGVDISGPHGERVNAVFSGKVAFAGTLPGRGQVALLDHGHHYYTLYAQLGQLTKKTGDWLQQGEQLGLTDQLGTPIYFEIRSRNVAVNPLQWFRN